MKFEQLNAEQQAKAIELHRDINVDFPDWNDSVKSDHHDILIAAGFEDVNSLHSGFWSQGSGASFTAGNVDIEKFLRSQKRWTHYRPLHEYIRIKDITCNVIRTDHRYYHENTTEASISGEWVVNLSPKQEKLYEELEKEIDKYITQAGLAYYRALAEEYDYLTSNEQVKESIIANDMDFEEDPRDAQVTYL